MEQNIQLSLPAKIFFVLIGFGLSCLLSLIFLFLFFTLGLEFLGFFGISKHLPELTFFPLTRSMVKALNAEGGFPLELLILSSIVVFLYFRRRQKFIAYGAVYGTLAYFIFFVLVVFPSVVAHLLR